MHTREHERPRGRAAGFLRHDARLHASRGGADDRRWLLSAGIRSDYDRKRSRCARRGDRSAGARHQGIGRSVIALKVVANVVRFVGLAVTILGLWYSAGGMRVVVSG